MRFRGGEFSTGTKGNFQSELTDIDYEPVCDWKDRVIGRFPDTFELYQPQEIHTGLARMEQRRAAGRRLAAPRISCIISR